MIPPPRRFTQAAVLLSLLPLCIGATAAPAAPSSAPGSLEVPATQEEVRVDGLLDEPFWQEALRLELGYEVRPAENQPPPVRTEVLLATTAQHLLVGFRAYDPEPQRIRARYRDRDNAWNDDFVGVVLDTFNDQRRAYELIANPLGVQTDAINDEASDRYDTAWDAIWESAGRITPEGYEVEFAIPFDQLRFQPSSDPQTWGFDAIRSYPRANRHHIGFFPRDRGQNSYLSQARKIRGFAAVETGANVQIVPTVTASRVDRRTPDGALAAGSQDTDLGLTGRWSVASNWTLSGTLNPDFSQVEADVLKLDVNEQFTLFFPETRPFFLEGADTFNTFLNLVHTRTVSDPSAALKVVGKQGRHTVGVFSARDEITNVLLPGSQGSRSRSFRQESSATAARYRFDLGGNSTVGVLFTDRGGGDYSNQVGSLDLRYRPTDRDAVRLQVALADTEYSAEMAGAFGLVDRTASGHAIDAGYSHSRRSWGVNANYLDRDEEFRADLGFLTQVDVRGFNADVYYTWHGEEDDFYNRLSTATWVYRNERQSGELLEEGFGVNFNGSLPREADFHIHATSETRRFRGRDFDLVRGGLFANTRPSASLWLALSGNFGDWIDFAGVRRAERIELRPQVALSLGRRFNSRLVYNYSNLEIEEGSLFTARGPEVRLLYYFNRRMYFRLIGQYTEVDTNVDLAPTGAVAEREDLLGQLLAVYQVNPQTAIYLGYGDEFDNRPQRDGAGLGGAPPPPGERGLRRQSRTFFVKVGYAWLP